MAVRTTRITVVEDKIMVISRACTERSWCPLCAADGDAVAIGGQELAELLAEGTARGWISAGQLHVSQRPDGSTRICLTSLLRCLEPKPNIAKETL